MEADIPPPTASFSGRLGRVIFLIDKDQTFALIFDHDRVHHFVTTIRQNIT
jgi:hypothetical protein